MGDTEVVDIVVIVDIMDVMVVVIFIDLDDGREEEDGMIKDGEDFLHGQVGIIIVVNVREVAL